MSLSSKTCIPCQGGVPPIDPNERDKLLLEIHPDWKLTHEGTRIIRSVKLKEMAQPMRIATLIAKMADEQWHHPELHIGFGHLDIEIWTHKIDALVESDFIFAAKVDEILKNELKK
jgi:4a-hydroxytetrahydrobiopterin dehydratase